MRPSSAGRRAPRSRGFTLIEVMAAVFILGLFVAAISQLLMQAQRNEGDARRRARAASLADQLLAGIEEGIARGAAPPLGTQEKRADDLLATTTVAAFDVAALSPGGAEGKAPGPNLRDQAAAAGWIEGPSTKAVPPVLEIAVRVSWDGAPQDADTQQAYGIQRRTFALNPAALETLSAEDSGDAGDDQGDE